jgi:hypothetical protein
MKKIMKILPIPDTPSHESRNLMTTLEMTSLREELAVSNASALTIPTGTRMVHLTGDVSNAAKSLSSRQRKTWKILDAHNLEVAPPLRGGGPLLECFRGTALTFILKRNLKRRDAPESTLRPEAEVTNVEPPELKKLKISGNTAPST